ASLVGVPLGGTSSEIFVGMLKSRTIASSIIDKYELMTVYGHKYRSTTYSTLESNVAISVGKDDGIITIAVADRDPDRSCRIANSYVEELQKLHLQLSLSTLHSDTRFLEKRFADAAMELISAENRLKVFQETNQAIRVDEQAKATIDALAGLQAQLTAAEIELGVLSRYKMQQSPEVVSLKTKVQQIQYQIDAVENGRPSSKRTSSVLLQAAGAPELTLEYSRMLRDFKVKEAVYGVIVQQLEMSRINESKNTSSIQILDSAVPPDVKTRPKRAVIVLVTMFTSCLGSILVAYLKEATKNLSQSDKQRLTKVRSLLPPPFGRSQSREVFVSSSRGVGLSNSDGNL
ncbi:MAG: GumC family protein, partial [Armatimonadota bacterium]